MVRRFRILAAIAVVVSFVVLTACGGGGNDVNNGAGNTEPIILPSQQSNATFTTVAGRTMVQQIGDLKFTVPSGTFAAPTQVSITRSSPVELPQFGGYTPVQNANCRISISAAPAGSITIEPVVPVTNRGVGKVVWFFLKGVAGNWRIINDVVTSDLVKVEKAAFGVANTIDGIVGHFLLTPPETVTGLVPMAQNPDGYSFAAMIMVHGINGQVSDLQALADAINTWPIENRCSRIFGFRYDYRQDPAVSAQALAGLIDGLRRQGFEYISLVGHSLGAVVARDVVVNRRCQPEIGDLRLINGANHGSKWANAADFVKWLEEDCLNNHPTNTASLLATIDNPVVAALKFDSPYIRGLNTVRAGRPLSTAYYLVGGNLDTVVSKDSNGQSNGAGFDIPFEQMTSSIVNRWELDGDHSSLIDTAAGRNQMLSTMWPRIGTWVQVRTDPTQQTDAESDGWHYTFVVENDGDNPVTVNDIAVHNFDRSNAWTSFRFVSDRAGSLSNPGDYARIDLPLAPGQQLRFPIHEPVDGNGTPIEQAPLTLQARTHAILARFTEHGFQFTWDAQIRLHHGNVWSTGQTRQARSHR